MRCPRCAEEMREVPKYNVNIDICPRCRGVFLDRGELEKILGLVKDYETNGEFDNIPPKQYDEPKRYHDNAKPYKEQDKYPYGKRKKKGLMGMLGDLFED